jgi:UDP-GlcNAc:undecaprenyl-phosphate/decaprenyl-phosphate GlcNAc-1-phosphate transferase
LSLVESWWTRATILSSPGSLPPAIFFSPTGIIFRHHIHHRLLAMGMSHRQAVLVLYVIAMVLSGAALLSLLAQYRNAGLILLSALLATVVGVHKLGYDDLHFLRSHTLLRWYDRLSLNRIFFAGFIDLALMSVAYWGAFFLKYENSAGPMIEDWYRGAFPLVLLLQMMVFTGFGLYRRVWRATNFADTMRLGVAAGGAVLLSAVMLHVGIPPEGCWSFFFIDFLLLGGLFGGSRNVYRILELTNSDTFNHDQSALIYGAGRGGQLVLKELRNNDALGIRPVGFLDDSPLLRGRAVNTVPVLGGADDLERLLETMTITHIIVSTRSVSWPRLSRTLDLCKIRGVPVLMARFHFEPMDENYLTAIAPPSVSFASSGSHASLSFSEGQV